LKEVAEEESHRQAEDKAQQEKLEIEIRSLRSALSSLPQDFLAEIKLPQSNNKSGGGLA
jgi:hypothetical protein